MHSAPAVSYPVARSALAGIAMLAVWLAGAAGITLWILHVGTAPFIALSAVGAVLAIGAIALRAWLRSPAGTLAWDGESWSWTTAAGLHSGMPEVALDAQRLLLLRWQGAGGVRWLWLDRWASPARWDDVRRAVYSRASPRALTGAKHEGDAKP